MILADQLFSKMPFRDWLATVRPKVEGSILLDELCAGKDLDFFILMGSISGPIGNRSQSPYAAANTFMSGLIQGRRKRGLPGSIINPGQIVGVGYVSNADAWLLKHLESVVGCYHMSEQDLHELFAEGILAGRPDSGRNPEIIAGFRRASPADQPDILWYRNPKTWHFIDHFVDSSAQSGDASSGGKAARVPVKEQLAAAASADEVAAVVEAGFVAKLRGKLQMSDEAAVAGDDVPAELGVDSLIAVDLRAWFVKEVGVDMPVLKILGGSSIGQLAGEAAAKLLPALGQFASGGGKVQEPNGVKHVNGVKNVNGVMNGNGVKNGGD